MQSILRILLFPFFTALGVEIGGPVIGSIPALLIFGRPLKTAVELAGDMKIWAIAIAIGGSFTVLEALESGLVHHQLHQVLKQGAAIAGAFAGAQTGYWIIAGLTRS